MDWRKSSFSFSSDCVEVAKGEYKEIAIRNSRYPEQGMLVIPWDEFDAFIRGIQAGEFDEFDARE